MSLRPGVVLSCLLLAAAVTLPGSAAAVDVVNEDPQSHRLVLVETGETMTVTIRPHGIYTDVCTACVVRVVAPDGRTAEVAAEEGDTVVIRAGRPVNGG